MTVRAPKRSAISAKQRFDEEYVCWTRMQSEAGQDLDQIIARKELERRAGNGLFAWGVGSAPSTIIPTLARAHVEVDIYFSKMLSRAKAEDAAPTSVYVWRSYFDADGAESDLPPHLIVTSRAHTASGPKRRHFALLCFSERRLALSDQGPFDPASFRNASGSGGKIGNSQVTALLVQKRQCRESAPYRIALSARLIGGLWVRLGDPLRLTNAKVARLNKMTKRAGEASPAEWLSLAKFLREPQPRRRASGETTGELFEFA